MDTLDMVMVSIVTYLDITDIFRMITVNQHTRHLLLTSEEIIHSFCLKHWYPHGMTWWQLAGYHNVTNKLKLVISINDFRMVKHLINDDNNRKGITYAIDGHRAEMVQLLVDRYAVRSQWPPGKWSGDDDSDLDVDRYI